MSLVELDASSNQISYVHREAFLSLHRLEKLDLSSNSLMFIIPKTFSYNRNLKWLSLERNQFSEFVPALQSKSLEHLILSSSGISTFPTTAFLPNLKELYLSHNKIEELATLKGVQILRFLDLSNNHLRSLDAGFLDEFPGLIRLDLRNNWMNSLNVEVVQKLDRITGSDELEGNPWVCDCMMFNTTYSWCRENFQNLSIRCSSPLALKGKPWTQYEENGCEDGDEVAEVVEIFVKPSDLLKSQKMRALEAPVERPSRVGMSLAGFEMSFIQTTIILAVMCLLAMSVAGVLWYKLTKRNNIRDGPSMNSSEKRNLRLNSDSV